MVWFGKKKKLSFGIDWSENAVKIVGLRMLGSGFELTHCLLFDLPAHRSPDEAQEIVHKRLQKINFHGGTVTINLPSDVVRPSDSAGDGFRFRRLSFGKNSGGEKQPFRVEADAETLQSEWERRRNLLKTDIRLEVSDFALPLLEPCTDPDELVIYLHLGFEESRLTIIRNGQIAGFQKVSFVVGDFVPPKGFRKQEQIIYRFLRNVRLETGADPWKWHSNQNPENAPTLFSHLENQIADLAGKIRNQVKECGVILHEENAVLVLVGPGGLYPWLWQGLRAHLQIRVRPAAPFSRLHHQDNTLESRKLRRISPLFAQAVAMALSGSKGRKSPYPDFARKLRSVRQRGNTLKNGVRLTSLTAILVSLLAYGAVSLKVNQFTQKTEQMQLEMLDMQQQLKGLENRVRLASHLSSATERGTADVSFSRIFRHLGEWLPNGCWLDEVQFLPAREVAYLKEKRKSSASAVVFRGEAISGNFIIDFFDNLKKSGFFSVVVLSKRTLSSEPMNDSVPFEIAAKIR